MGTIIAFKPKEDDQAEPYMTGPARCLACEYEWTAVVPVGVVGLECPKCGIMKGFLRYPVERQELEWTCNCGNRLFRITPDGIYCPHCGDWQQGF